jgi:hypothetical protein
LVLLARNSLISFAAALIPYDKPHIQVNVMQIILLASICFTISYRPWKTKTLSIMDTLTAVSLLMGLNFALRGLDKGMELEYSVALLVLVLSLLIGSMVFVGYMTTRTRLSKGEFTYFLSHHKGAGGNSARLLKFLLELSTRGRCFYDSDNLESLGGIFDAVKLARNFVIIFSGEILCRRWCIGEIVTAQRNNINMFPLVFTAVSGYLDKYLIAEDEQMSSTLTSFESLSPYGISIEDCQEAIQNVLDLERITCATCIDGAKQLARVVQDPNATVSFHSRGAFYDDLLKHDVDTTASTKMMLIGDGGDPEAVSVTYFIKLTLQKIAQISIYTDIADEIVHKQTLEVMANCEIIGVTVTSYMFESASLAPRLVYAMRLPPGRMFQPLLTCKDFAFATPEFIANMALTGQPLGKKPADAIMKVMALTKELADLGIEELSTKEVSEAYNDLFKRITMPFEINYSSQLAIEQQRDAVMSRLKLNKMTHKLKLQDVDISKSHQLTPIGSVTRMFSSGKFGDGKETLNDIVFL